MDLKTWIMIPPSAFNDDRLSDVDRVLLGVIISMIGQTGYFWKSNAFLAGETDRSERSVQRSIRSLKKSGYLVVKQEKGYRRISVDLTGGDRFVVEGMTDLSPEVLVTSDTNSNKETTSRNKGEKREAEIRDVFEHWEKRRADFYAATNRSFVKPRLTDARRGHINARLNDGVDVETMKKAIDGLFSSDWHMERGVIELEKVVRAHDRIEFFLRHYDNAFNVTSANDLEEWEE